MRKGLTFLSSVALLALSALPMPASAAPHANTVVASVNGEEITVGHMIMAREALPEQYKQLPDDVLYDAILDQLIQQTALKQELNGEVPLHVALSVDNEKRALLAASVMQNIMQKANTEDAIRAAYEAKYSGGNGGDEFNASHILVGSQADANSVLEELEAGADFAILAKERSTGPSGPNGGNLGWFTTGQMVPPFEEAVLGLKAGQFSEPVATQFGWHVILLHERRKSEAPAFEDVRAELARELQNSAVESRIADLTAAAVIERPAIEGLEPAILKDVQLVGN